MADNWPLTSNAHGCEPFTETVVPSLVIEENDVGAPNMRNRTTAPRIFHTFTMYFNDTEWETVKYFVRANLKNGIESFKFPKVDEYTSDTTQWVEYRFALEMTGGAWYSNYTHNYNLHTVTFTLELL